MTPTQEDIKLLKQPSRTIYAKFDVLNINFKTVGSLEGKMISDTYSYDADSDIRKTANISLYVSDSSLVIGNNGQVWFDKYLKLYVGLLNLYINKIVWYEIGTFVYVDVGYQYDATTKQLDINISDMMVLLNGTRNGEISGLSTSIGANASIRGAMVYAVNQLGRIQKYRIEDPNELVPYDLDFSTGATVYEIIKELRDLYIGWQTYFDNDTFVYEPYPVTTDYPIVLDDSIMQDLIISESESTSFSDVYNVVEVWGKCLETDTYTTDVSYNSTTNTYTLTNSAIESLEDGVMYGFKANVQNNGNDYIKINSFTSYPLYGKYEEDFSAGKIDKDKSYVIKYMSNGSQSYFYFCGEYQICAVAKLISKELADTDAVIADISNEPTSNVNFIAEHNTPFGIDLIGEQRKVLSGGEYDNIYSEDLAMQRAKYELWKYSDMKDEITLTMIDIPWLDVNQKVEYTSQSTGIKDVYIIKKKQSSTTGGTMTLSLVKFVPIYSWA